MSCRIKVFH